MLSIHVKTQMRHILKCLATHVTFKIPLLVPGVLLVTDIIYRDASSGTVGTGSKIDRRYSSTWARVIVLNTFTVIMVQHPFRALDTLMGKEFQFTKFTV